MNTSTIRSGQREIVGHSDCFWRPKEVYHGSNNANGALIFSIENGRRNTGRRSVTILLNSELGDYYGIKTSGYERVEKLRKRPLLWERSVSESPSTDAATEPVTTLDALQSGEQSGNASGQSGLSEGKDNTNLSSPQGNSEKNNQPSFSLSPEDDAEYLDAVEKGDMEKAEKMYTDAVKKAMPNTKVVDRKGPQDSSNMLFWGTPEW